MDSACSPSLEYVNAIRMSIFLEPPKKPKRCLTAYNIFFQQERLRLLSSLGSRTVKRGHGKISFADLARTVSMKWKATPKDQRQVYEHLASQDKIRYMSQMKAWKRIAPVSEKLRLKQQKEEPSRATETKKIDVSASTPRASPNKNPPSNDEKEAFLSANWKFRVPLKPNMSCPQAPPVPQWKHPQWKHRFSPNLKHISRLPTKNFNTSTNDTSQANNISISQQYSVPLSDGASAPELASTWKHPFASKLKNLKNAPSLQKSNTMIEPTPATSTGEFVTGSTLASTPSINKAESQSQFLWPASDGSNSLRDSYLIELLQSIEKDESLPAAKRLEYLHGAHKSDHTPRRQEDTNDCCENLLQPESNRDSEHCPLPIGDDSTIKITHGGAAMRTESMERLECQLGPEGLRLFTSIFLPK